jgi:hypothetical protein
MWDDSEVDAAIDREARALTSGSTRPDFSARVLARMAHEPPRLRPRWLWTFVLPPLGTAAAGCAIVGVVLLLLRSSPMPQGHAVVAPNIPAVIAPAAAPAAAPPLIPLVNRVARHGRTPVTPSVARTTSSSERAVGIETLVTPPLDIAPLIVGGLEPVALPPLEALTVPLLAWPDLARPIQGDLP